MNNDTLFILAVSALLAGLVYLGLLMVRNELAYKQFIRISNAIYYYVDSNIPIEGTPAVWYTDMADYDDIASRIWDWSDKGILPPEKYEIIKPFIKQ